MKAVIVQRYGSPQDFVLADMPRPEPGQGEVRIRTAAAGVSFVDLLIAAGRYQARPPLPFIPGSEIAGTVDAVGPEVHGLKPGDRVAAAAPLGAWAEFLCVPQKLVMAVPESVAFPQAAVFQVPCSTALLALQNRGGLRPGEILFVPGAAGAVGLAAIMIGKLLGARVIAGAATPGKREAVRAAGADAVLDTGAADWPRSLKAATAGHGIDVVLDPVGGPRAEAVFRCLAWGGRYLAVGFASGTIPAIGANWALLKGAALVGVNLNLFDRHEPEAAMRMRAQLAAWLGQGRLAPPIARCFPLPDFAQAAALAADRQTVGRVVLTMEPAGNRGQRPV